MISESFWRRWTEVDMEEVGAAQVQGNKLLLTPGKASNLRIGLRQDSSSCIERTVESLKWKVYFPSEQS